MLLVYVTPTYVTLIYGDSHTGLRDADVREACCK